jgi:hypothetical protein
MDREHDPLVLVLTSHGTPQGIGIRPGGCNELLTPDRLRAYLAETGAATKVAILRPASPASSRRSPTPTRGHHRRRSTHPSFGYRIAPT